MRRGAAGTGTVLGRSIQPTAVPRVPPTDEGGGLDWSRLAGLDPKRWMEYGGSAGAGALDFRWGVTWRIAADVRAGLGKED